MGKPVIKLLSTRSFLDGSVVYENDAKISGQIEGNVELSDIKHSRSTYNITVGPVYYGPDSTVVTEDTEDDWETPDVAVCVFRAPRDLVITRLQVYVTNEILLGADDQCVVNVQSLTGSAGDFGPSGAYRDNTWTTGPFTNITGDSTAYGSSETWDASYSENDHIRIFISNRVVSSSADKNRPQAEMVITITVEEDHAE